MEITTQSKLPDTGTSIFTVMSALATQAKAINLGQGFPDFPMSEQLTSLVDEAMKAGYNQYSPMEGWLPLREAICEKIAGLYQSNVDPHTQVTITPGGTYAIYTALTSILQPGDEVIVFEPAYDSYLPNIKVNGAIAVRIDLKFPEYKIDWNVVREKLTGKTRVIMINSPHNPTGAVLDEHDIKQLQSIVEGTDIVVLSDEVYEHLIFDGISHQSMLRYPDLAARSFTCFSFGKVYHCTGWKLGYCVASPQLTNEFRKIHQFNCFSCHTPSQVALSKFISQKESYMGLSSFMQSKRDYFQRLMQQTKFTPLPSHGSYFQCYKYDQISAEGDKDLCIRMTKEIGVAAIPVSAFYQARTDNNVIRFCFSKKNETLEMAVERLVSLA